LGASWRPRYPRGVDPLPREEVAARWPARLIELCEELRLPDPSARAREECWVLVRDALVRFLRGYAARQAAVNPEDLEDLASSKALEILVRVESGEWDPRGRHPAEVAGYLATVARNGLSRLAGQQARRPLSLDAETPGAGSLAERLPGDGVAPDVRMEAREFVEALRECAGRLQPRSRVIWFLRAALELPSRDIAAHPAVGLNVPHVDVILQRARDALRECLRSRGWTASDFPAGAFAAMWPELAALTSPGVAAANSGGAGHDD